MLRRVLSLVLIVAVVDCPMLCGAVSVTAPQDAGVPSCCCCRHCDGALSSDDGSEPSDEPQEGAGLFQCICNGAVVEQGALQSFEVDLGCWAPVAANVSPIIQASAAELVSLHAALQPDCGMNEGRAMRCLFMSLLC